MPRNHRCSDSDHISKISADNGFASWQTVWNANGSLRSRRNNPNLLFKGDRFSQGDLVRIPDPEVGSGSGSSGSTLSFELTGETLFLRMRILKDDFTAAADAAYTLAVEGAPAPFTGRTDGNGQFEIEIPRSAQRGELIVRVRAADSEPAGSSSGSSSGVIVSQPVRGDVPVTWQLKIGALNPVMENAPDRWCIAGVQQRLNNLCLNTGPVDGIRGPNTKAAIKAFQELFGLNPDGKPGQMETQPKLVDVHDKPDSILGPVPAATA